MSYKNIFLWPIELFYSYGIVEEKLNNVSWHYVLSPLTFFAFVKFANSLLTIRFSNQMTSILNERR